MWDTLVSFWINELWKIQEENSGRSMSVSQFFVVKCFVPVMFFVIQLSKGISN